MSRLNLRQILIISALFGMMVTSATAASLLTPYAGAAKMNPSIVTGIRTNANLDDCTLTVSIPAQMDIGAKSNAQFHCTNYTHRIVLLHVQLYRDGYVYADNISSLPDNIGTGNFGVAGACNTNALHTFTAIADIQLDNASGPSYKTPFTTGTTFRC